MDQNLPSTVPVRPCGIAWCDQTHPRPGYSHVTQIGMWDLDGSTVEVLLCQNREPGSAPYVRVLYGPDWAPSEILDIPGPLVGKLGEIVAMLTITTYSEFASALTRAAVVLRAAQ